MHNFVRRRQADVAHKPHPVWTRMLNGKVRKLGWSQAPVPSLNSPRHPWYFETVPVRTLIPTTGSEGTSWPRDWNHESGPSLVCPRMPKLALVNQPQPRVARSLATPQLRGHMDALGSIHPNPNLDSPRHPWYFGTASSRTRPYINSSHRFSAPTARLNRIVDALGCRSSG